MIRGQPGLPNSSPTILEVADVNDSPLQGKSTFKSDYYFDASYLHLNLYICYFKTALNNTES